MQAAHDLTAGVEAAPEGKAVEGLASLVDKSLLQPEEGMHGEPRFRMLETIREFGLSAWSVWRGAGRAARPCELLSGAGGGCRSPVKRTGAGHVAGATGA